MEVRLLGPVQVVADDRRLLRLGPRQVKVLAALVLADRAAVSLKHLVEVVWGDSQPRTARQQIHNAIWLVRKLLPVVAEGDGGYRLLADRITVDVRQFHERAALANAAVATGQPEQALELFDVALRLWRGPALAGCESPALAARAAGLDEQRLIVVSQYVDLRLRLGLPQNLIGELTELVAAYPTREVFVAQLMTALHGDRHGVADTLDSLGYIHHRLGQDAEAVSCFTEALAGYREIASLYGEAETLARLGDAHHTFGRPTEAEAAWREALVIFDHLSRKEAEETRAKLALTMPCTVHSGGRSGQVRSAD